ncbi:MAG: hypothetical protein AAFR11_05575 [Pseudomonadota bacterium]
MADRTIKVLENGRAVTRGIAQTEKDTFTVKIFDDDQLTYTIDWSNWLGSDTIASVDNDSQGATIVSSSNTTTTATLQLSASRGSGYIDHTITTTTSGDKKSLRIKVINDDHVWRDDYYYGRPY